MNVNNQPTFDEIFTIDHLTNSALKYFKHKTSLHVVFIKSKLKLYIKRLHEELTNGTFTFSSLKAFKKLNGGKIRNISKLRIKDAIVHKCLCQFFIVPHLMKNLIYDNCASQKYKGLHFAFRRIKQFLKRHYDEYQLTGGALIFDVKDFFETIDHDVLKRILSKKIKDEKVYDFLCQIIDINQHVVKRKKFKDKLHQGLGVGTEMFQLFALLYVSSLDHYIKETLRIKFYLRYVDDAIMLLPSIKELRLALKKINQYMKDFNLTLNHHKTMIVNFKQTNKITFLKMNFFIGRKVITKLNHSRIKKNINTWQEELTKGLKSLQEIKQAYQAWRAYALYTDDYKNIKHIDKIFNEKILSFFTT